MAILCASLKSSMAALSIAAASIAFAGEPSQSGSAAPPDLAAQLAALQAEVANLKDRQAVHEVYVRYGRGIDRLDEELYRSAFWPDAQINYGTAESITVDQHWANHMIKWHKDALVSWGHLLTNEAVDIEGDAAHVEVYLTRLVVPKEEQSADKRVIAGRYIDRLERRNDEWRIAVREFIPHFAMRVDTSNYASFLGGMFRGLKTDCVSEPSGKRDPSYVRPLARRAKEAGPPCAERGGAPESFATTPHSTLVPLNEAKFGQAQRYGSIQRLSHAPMWADPASRRSTELIKLSKGSTPAHYHQNHDMQVVVIKGTLTHWMQGSPGASAKRLGPGTYWYQPAGEVHQNSCLVDECIILVSTFNWGEMRTVDIPDTNTK